MAKKRPQGRYIVDRRSGMSADTVLKIFVGCLISLLMLGMGKWIDSIERRADNIDAKIETVKTIEAAKAERLVTVESGQRVYGEELKDVKEKLECLRVSIDNLRKELVQGKESSVGGNGKSH